MDAIILAAGRGERLRPLTDRAPKPLIMLHGQALIELHILRLAQSGINNIVVNLAHLGQLIEQQLGNGEHYGVNIQYSHETHGALETAGGIIQALPKLGGQTFLAVNADIVCDFNFKQLRRLAVHKKQLASLVMVPNPAQHPDGDFNVEGNFLINSPSKNSNRMTFSGIGLYERSLFDSVKHGKRPLAPMLHTAIEAGKISSLEHHGIWRDIGTLERLESARQDQQIQTYINSFS